MAGGGARHVRSLVCDALHRIRARPHPVRLFADEVVDQRLQPLAIHAGGRFDVLRREPDDRLIAFVVFVVLVDLAVDLELELPHALDVEVALLPPVQLRGVELPVHTPRPHLLATIGSGGQ